MPYLALAATALVAQFMSTFEEFPPRQKAASFTIDQVVREARKRTDLRALTLSYWNDGPARTAILDFVDRVREGGRHRLRAARRAHRGARQRRHALAASVPRTSRRCSCSAAFEAAADRPALAEQPVVKALLAGDLTASRLGRTVVSMRRDWNRVFAG